jgi:NUBPL iron-transfer P-loop NTPase
VTVRLHCYSFHSVKGGVGKSTLATLLASGLARDMPTTLVDMDLTGTSLGDVLPLEAPRWSGAMRLAEPPDGGFHDRDQTRECIAKRGGAPKSALAEPPYLNDFLLYADPEWDISADMHTDSLGWRMRGADKNLRVFPSSALPRDLERILPVIFDEEHAAFLEGRLEFLLDGIVRHSAPDVTERAVVFDTPPTIPGLSRTVLGLALRLGRADKRPLADDNFIPAALERAEVRWTIFVVVTMDMQDLRAANRWLELVQPDEERFFRVVVNRVSAQIEPDRIDAEIERKVLDRPAWALGETPLGDSYLAGEGPLFPMFRIRRIPVEDAARIRFFGEESGPPTGREIDELLRNLRGM